MPTKKNTPTRYISSTQTTTSYFMERILPSLISAAIMGFIATVSLYFRYESTAQAVSGFPDTYVRKDVLIEMLEPMRDDLREIKTDVKEIREKDAQ